MAMTEFEINQAKSSHPQCTSDCRRNGCPLCEHGHDEETLCTKCDTDGTVDEEAVEASIEQRDRYLQTSDYEKSQLP